MRGTKTNFAPFSGLVLFLLLARTYSQLNMKFSSQVLSLPFNSLNNTYNFSIASNNHKITFIQTSADQRADCFLNGDGNQYQGCLISAAGDVHYAQNLWYGLKGQNYVIHGVQTFLSNQKLSWQGLDPLTVSFGVEDTYYAMLSNTRCSLITDYHQVPANWSTINATISCSITEDGSTLITSNSTGIQIRTLVNTLDGYSNLFQSSFSSPNPIFSQYGVSTISRDGRTIATSYTLQAKTYSLISIWVKGSNLYQRTDQTFLVDDSCPIKTLKFSSDGLRLLAATGNKYEFYTRQTANSKFSLTKSETYRQTGSNPSSNCNNSLADISYDGSIIAYVTAQPGGSPVPSATITFATVQSVPTPSDPAKTFKILTGVGFGLAFILILALICVGVKHKKLINEIVNRRKYKTIEMNQSTQPPAGQSGNAIL